MSKLPNVTWPKGTFVETVKGWQKEWFYVTEPRDSTWATPAEFKSGRPMRLASWVNKGLDRASFDEVTVLQKRIKRMVDKNTSLPSVIQVMLFRRILPCQARQEFMWEFEPAGPRTLQRFFSTKHEDMWKLLFKNQKSWLETTEDLGYDNTHASTPVSSLITLLCEPKEHTKLSIFFFRAGQRKRNEFTIWLRCPKTKLFLC